MESAVFLIKKDQNAFLLVLVYADRAASSR